MPVSFLARGVVAALAASALACGTTLPPRPWTPAVRRPVVMDVEHYDVELTIDHRARHVAGEVAVTLSALDETPLTEVELDAVELDVSRAWHSDGELAFELRPETVIVTLPEPLAPGASTTIHLAYEAFPRRGLYFEGPSRSDPTRPWHVWSQGQAHEARHWLPCWDQPTDRASSELTLVVDDDFRTLAAGTLTTSETRRAQGLRADTWIMTPDHPSYLMTIVVGELGEGRLQGSVPLPVVARERDMDAALFATRHTEHMLQVMGELTGRPYPFDKYAQAFVDDFTSGGMENITATTMYDEGLHVAADEPQVDITGLVAHELAHQWFGDLLTCEGWEHLWINEGWADWLETRYIGALHGETEMRAQYLDAQHGGIRAEDAFSRPVVWPGYEDPDQMFDGHSYAGGSARIQLLSSVLGEEVFLRCVAAHVETHAHDLVTTDELQAVFEATSGVDLDRFFEEWFHGVGYPVLVGEVRDDELVVRQTQGERYGREVFRLDVSVAWSRGGVEHRGVLSFDDEPEQRQPLDGDGELDWVRLDADTVLPALRHMRQSQAAWTRQLTGAEDGVTRLVAALWFAGQRATNPEGAPDELEDAAVAALLSAARDDAFFRVRVAAVDALPRHDDETVGAALIDLAGDADPRVRAAAVSALSEHLEGTALDVVRAATRDANGTVASAAMAVLVDAERPEAWSTLTERMAAEDGGRIRFERDLVRLAADVDDPEVVPFLVGVARTHPERWVRSAAVSSLGRLEGGAHDEAVLRELLTALGDESHQVRRSAVFALRDRDDERVARHLRARLDLEPDPGVMSALESALRR